MSYLTGIKSQRQHAVKAGLDKLQSVGRSRQEEGGGETVPLFTDTHIHNVAGCCIYILWNLQQENTAFDKSTEQSKAMVSVKQIDLQFLNIPVKCWTHSWYPGMQGSLLFS